MCDFFAQLFMAHCSRISIVTACFNSSATLRTMLESIRAQAQEKVFPKNDIECIVIDGGSTDGTQDILREFEDVITFWSSEPDKGIADAFSKGVARATGEWIAVLGTDDAYLPQAFRYVREYAERFPGTDILYGEAILEQVGNTAVVQRALPLEELSLYHSFICHQAVFARKSVFDRIGGFHEQWRFAMDYDWLLRAHNAGCIFQPMPHTQVVRYSLAGASGQYRVKALREMRDIAIKHGLNKHECYRQYRIAVFKSTIESLMQKAGLQPVIHLYRTRIKKRYATMDE